ncbi:hypothetical protein BDV28DRAFT_145297 [Aspergillus coremiiformis]|uniref:Uncharacterized protein n=1 Tax=Aspergillus coremiiformis TaxID=138285 RepID=A0A5N6ZGA8_9EURO|nr:hypothetical protein BDV28DRAFT_145297 [Aspergillus coremiiformis]
MGFLTFITHKQPDHHLLEATPYPFAQHYFKIEIDIPRPKHDGKHKAVSVLSIISESIEQLRDPSSSQHTPTLPTDQKYGRVQYRVQSATIDTAFEDLRQYLMEVWHHVEKEFKTPKGFLSMPLKCRRDKCSPALFVMRWCEGGRNRLSVWPVAIDVPRCRSLEARDLRGIGSV